MGSGRADPRRGGVLHLGRWVRGCVSAALNAGEGSTLPEREYALSVYVGGTLRQVTFMQTTVQSDQPAGSFNVVGRIVDADTGEPIEFAFVTVLKPGTDLQAWYDNPDDTQVASNAITDENGEYSTQPPVAPNRYPFLVQAFGYQTIGGEPRPHRGRVPVGHRAGVARVARSGGGAIRDPPAARRPAVRRP